MVLRLSESGPWKLAGDLFAMETYFRLRTSLGGVSAASLLHFCRGLNNDAIVSICRPTSPIFTTQLFQHKTLAIPNLCFFCCGILVGRLLAGLLRL